MKEKQVAKIYAHAIKELKQGITSEFASFMELLNSSSDFENVMFLQNFQRQEKQKVLEDVMEKANFYKELKGVLNFLLAENRFSIAHMIYAELVMLEDLEKGFVKGLAEGPDAQPNAELVEKAKAIIGEKIGKKIEIQYKQNKDLTAGLKMTVGDYQLDGTLDHQLEQFEKTTQL